MVPLNITELVSHEILLIRVQLPGGAAIIFAQSWNFELKFFVDNPFMKKINSMGVRSHFIPKNGPNQPKDCIQNIAYRAAVRPLTGRVRKIEKSEAPQKK